MARVIADRFAEYDLNNEMMHANYYEQRFGIDFIRQMALWVKEGDPNAKLFVNDYDITTGNRLDDYVKHIREAAGRRRAALRHRRAGPPAWRLVRSAMLQKSLDDLSQFKLPIRITEFNFPGQRSKYIPATGSAVMPPEEEQAKAEALKQFYTICFAHPAVTGIMMWGFWEGANWIPQSSLYKRDWTPLPAAKAYEDLVLHKWWTRWTGTRRSARPGRGARVLWNAQSHGERERDGGDADEGGGKQDGRAELRGVSATGFNSLAMPPSDRSATLSRREYTRRRPPPQSAALPSPINVTGSPEVTPNNRLPSALDRARDAAIPNASPKAANPSVRRRMRLCRSPGGRSQRHPNSNFLHPLTYRIRNHGVDPQRGEDQGESRESGQQQHQKPPR